MPGSTMDHRDGSETQSEQAAQDIRRSPGHLMRRCQQIAVAIFLDEFRELALTPMQYAALRAIRARPGMDQRTLVDLIAIDRSTTGAILGALEERGLVSRLTPRHNQRIKQLFLTPLGEDIVLRSSGPAGRVEERMLAPLNADEAKLFLSLLGRLVDGNNEFSRAPVKLDDAAASDRTNRENDPKWGGS